MAIDATGHEIFLGTRGSGILIFDSISGKMGRHTIQNNDHLEVTSVLRLSNDTVLVASFNSGLFHLERTVVGNSTVYLASTITKAPITILEK